MNNLNIPDTNQPRVVIIGCGFAGLNLAKKLKKQAYQVVLVDKHNYHTFQPLLYQVATAGLEPDSIAQPIRTIFRKYPNFFFRMAEAHSVKPEEQILNTNIGPLHYDYLVIATGSSTNYFGMKRVEELAIPMKSVPEALNLRSLILQNFEAASLTNDFKERERLMNFVIVGAGPTGTELAGALAELKMHVLPNDYPDLDFRRMSIHLVEMADKVLPPMSEFSSTTAKAYLDSLGVQVWLNTAVKDYDGATVTTDKGKKLPASTLIWAAGVTGALIDGFAQGDDYAHGRYLVDEFNKVGQHKTVFAIGDVAAMLSDKDPKGHPMLAQVAIQQGQNLAHNLIGDLKNKSWQPFKYNDMGTMATVGRNKAVAELYNKINLKGFAGWFVWMMVHLISLVGFRNRVVVLFNWFVNYFSYDRKIRLIIRPVNRQREAEKELALDAHKEAVKP
jgi:NADH dehydrogenase